jgi:hypothetical protein
MQHGWGIQVTDSSAGQRLAFGTPPQLQLLTHHVLTGCDDEVHLWRQSYVIKAQSTSAAMLWSVQRAGAGPLNCAYNDVVVLTM